MAAGIEDDPPTTTNPLLQHLPRVGSGVFTANRSRPIHRWYPFLEGYSADLVEWGLQVTGHDCPRILDPFGGSGTTALTAAEHNLDSWYCEVNPYLAWLADVKVNQSQQISSGEELEPLVKLLMMAEDDQLPSTPVSLDSPLLCTEDRRSYYPEGVARVVAATLDWIDKEIEGPVKQLGRAAVAVSLVPSSVMIRRTDLRRRKSKDKPPTPFQDALATALRMMLEDVRSGHLVWSARSSQLAADVRELSVPEGVLFDLIITSPPYLNGTNYFRNTKLELLALGFIDDEAELGKHRSQSITAGINNVSKRRTTPDYIEAVEPVAGQLDAVAYDQRIPMLVRMYFSDMRVALKALRNSASDDAELLLDIGDSRFAGVHVPTHDLLAHVGEQVGWHCVETVPLRERRSYDGNKLVQVVLRMSAQ